MLNLISSLIDPVSGLLDKFIEDKDATESSLTSKVEADKNPVSATGTPW